MNVPADSIDEFMRAQPGTAQSQTQGLRTFYWCVRREIWENKSIYLAPIAVAAIIILGACVATRHASMWTQAITGLPPGQQFGLVKQLYDFSAIAIIIVTCLVGWFYCLDALYSERRDRSILFWKSLPVSDLTAVLAKASIPMVVLPLVGFVVVLLTQFVLQQLASVVLLTHGLSVAPFYAELPVGNGILVLLYGQLVLAIGYAPVWSWLLMVSAWAQRMTFLWALLPPIGVCILERIGLGTTHVTSMLARLLGGGFEDAFTVPESGDFRDAIPAPLHYLSTPALWIGLAVAAVFLSAAIWLRRNRSPI